MNRLLLLDGNAILHRAYHAIPPLTSPDGQPVGAVYGFLTMLFRLNTDLKPNYLAVAFDRPKPTFRKKLFKAYQANRPEMEDALVTQIPKVHEVLESFHVPIFEVDGFEADDVIGTIVEKIKETERRRDQEIKKKNSVPDLPVSESLNLQIIIVTGDRDILQLVEDENVLVYMPVKGLTEAKLYGEKEVEERLGVTPKQIPDWKALAGDSADNYPGVPGIGPKTAADLVNRFQTIEKLYAAVAKGNGAVSERVTEKLIQGKESAELSKTLAIIRSDVPVACTPEALAWVLQDGEEVRAMLGKFGFHSLIKRLAVLTGNTEEIKRLGDKEVKKKKKIADSSGQMDLFS